MKKIVAIVQPTTSCNLNCKYCYIDENNSRKFMDKKTLENIIKKFAILKKNYDVNTHFLWHGGEPLLPGMDFYRDVISLQNKYYAQLKGVSNSIQTNLTLLNEKFLNFLVQNKIDVGFSLDGPKEINDSARVFKNGKGTFDKIMENVALMKEKNLKLRAIAVLNKKSINKLVELYSFFKTNEISFKVHPLVYAGRFKQNEEELEISQEDYGDALIKLFDVWFNDKEYKINIEPLYQYLGNLITGKPRECSTLFSCQERFISIDPEGNVYPCGRFSSISEFCYGNINQEPIEKILSSPIRRKLLERNSDSIKDCQICKYKKICNGGCMNNAYNAGNIFGKDDYCSAYKKIFEYLSSTLKKFPQLKQLKINENLESVFL